MSGNGPDDPFRFTTIAHAGRPVLGPLDPASIDALLAAIALPPGASVLDVGCGKGELLARVMARFGARGTGVEPNPAFVREARARFEAMGRAGQADLRDTTLAHAALPGQAYDLAICTGAAHAFGGLGGALAGLRGLARADGWALVGHGYWQREPEADYLAAFGGAADELEPLEAVLAAPARHGWSRVAHHASTPAEWDAYEHHYAGAMRAWLSAHPDDRDAPAFRDRIEAWSAAYERWGRTTMGFVTMVLRR